MKVCIVQQWKPFPLFPFFPRKGPAGPALPFPPVQGRFLLGEGGAVTKLGLGVRGGHGGGGGRRVRRVVVRGEGDE